MAIKPSRILPLFLTLIMLSGLIQPLKAKYAQDEPVYVRRIGNNFLLHNYFDDYYVSMKGIQISNNLTEHWADIIVGVNFTYRGLSYSFWNKGVTLGWAAYNGSGFARLTGTAQVISSLSFSIEYRLAWNQSYIKITPKLTGNLQYPIYSSILTYRLANITISGDSQNDLAAVPALNGREHFLPSDFTHTNSELNDTRFTLFDNRTWKFADLAWNKQYTLNGANLQANATIKGIARSDGPNGLIQAQFHYGTLPKTFTLSHVFWWHDPTDVRYFRSDTKAVNGLTAYILNTTQSSSSSTLSRASGLYMVWDFGVRAWKRDSTSPYNETEITSGTLVATISKLSGDPDGYDNNTWNCPQTVLKSSDSIVVKMYVKGTGEAWSSATSRTFQTEQLGATQLNSTTWIVVYYTRVTYNPTTLKYTGSVWHGSSSYNTRIENFIWFVQAQTTTITQVINEKMQMNDSQHKDIMMGLLEQIAITDTPFKGVSLFLTEKTQILDSVFKELGLVISEGLSFHEGVFKDLAVSLMEITRMTDIPHRIIELVIADPLSLLDGHSPSLFISNLLPHGHAYFFNLYVLTADNLLSFWGPEARVDVALKNFGTHDANVTLHYWVTDAQNATIYEGSQQVFSPANQTLYLNVTFPTPSQEGTYYVNAKAVDPLMVAVTAQTHFQVLSLITWLKMHAVWFLLLAIIIGATGTTAYAVKVRQKSKAKRVKEDWKPKTTWD